MGIYEAVVDSECGGQTKWCGCNSGSASLMSGLFDFHHQKSTDGVVMDGDIGSSKSRYMSLD